MTLLFFQGTAFLCSVLIAPIKNENGSIIMYIVNLEDVTKSPDLVDINMGKLMSFFHLNCASHFSYFNCGPLYLTALMDDLSFYTPLTMDKLLEQVRRTP